MKDKLDLDMHSWEKVNLGGTKRSKGREAGKRGPVWELEKLSVLSHVIFVCKYKKCHVSQRKWEC